MFSRKAAASAGILMLLMASALIATEYSLNQPNSFSGAASRRSAVQAPPTIQTSNGAATTPSPAPLPPPPQLKVHLEIPPQCRDKILNGEETDIDCGGIHCPPCDRGLLCKLDRDCKSKNCLNGRCGPDLCQPGTTRCEIDSTGKSSGFLEVCSEARQGFQRGEQCPNGCIEGKCIPSCTDSDGKDTSVQGSSSGVLLSNLAGPSTEQKDFCTGSSVQEFTCESDLLGRKGLVQSSVECPNGCTDGACKPCESTFQQPCNRNQCGGAGVYLCNGQCSENPPNLQFPLGKVGDNCNRNECGGTGTVTCTGTCSASAPPLSTSIGKVGSACNRNACGGTGVVQCGGTCSATAPQISFSIGTVGSACNRNQCGGSGTVNCGGSCSASAPYVPPNYGSSCGCGGSIQCSGSCSANDCGSGQVCQNGQCITPCVSYQGQACNRNQCGGYGTYNCDGSCSSSAPYVPYNYGQSCGCGGSIQCSGSCSANDCGSGQVCQNNQCVSAVTCSSTTVRQCYSSSQYMASYQYKVGTQTSCTDGRVSTTWGTVQSCPSGQTCSNGYCSGGSSTTPSDPCPGTLGCCCQYGYPDCASGYECRGWNVPGHQYFGTCTVRGQMYAAQLNSYEQPFCGR